MAWSEQRIRRAILALRYALDLAELDGCQADQLVDLILPKFIEHSGLDAITFQTIVHAMHRAEEERLATRH
jgi:hypothetical protein